MLDPVHPMRSAVAAPRMSGVLARWAAPTPRLRSLEKPLRELQVRLLEAQSQVRPGFMTLRAIRDGRDVVDFEWTFSSAGAGRMLGRQAVDLYGKRLLDVLRTHPGCDAIFQQYRRVVVVGAAGATRQVHAAQSGLDSIRHAAVRIADGVAVTLINVSAARRAVALGLAVQAQRPAVTAVVGD